jgi:putative phosphoribosyl transferase
MAYESEVFIDVVESRIPISGTLEIPDNPIGVILFAHGSGSSRFSPRNNAVASQLRSEAMATLLIDLLTPSEAVNYENRFNIDLLAERLDLVAEWVFHDPRLISLSLALFGASTGAAAALIVAAKRAKGINPIFSVVSRGGRPDLVSKDLLAQVESPTLLLVGGLDSQVIDLNQYAYSCLTCIKKLEIISGAGHLFEEPGALEQVSDHATQWFSSYFKESRI